MKIGIIINTSDPETAWNALRLANTARGAGHGVSVFLLGAGVETERISHPDYDVAGKLAAFLKGGGALFACGTCLKSRGLEPAVCPVSTMDELLQVISESDRVVTFG